MELAKFFDDNLLHWRRDLQVGGDGRDGDDGRGYESGYESGRY